MSQFLNTLSQIAHSDSVGTLRGWSRHMRWQTRKVFGQFPCELPLAGSRLHVDKPCGVGALVNAMGEYDYNNMSLLRLVLSHGNNTFVDVGANIGSYTLIAAGIPEARVVSIEPHPATFSQLQENVRLNGHSNVICLNLALSSRDGEVQLTDDTEPSLNRVISGEGGAVAVVRVPCRRLDLLLRELDVRLDILKIDVEGHEGAVLEGLGELDGLPTMIFIEGGERAEVRRWMLAAGYTGPWFVHFARRILGTQRQKRPEDPVYVRPEFLPELERLNFEVADSLSLANQASANTAAGDRLPVRAVFFTNFVAPYMLPVLQKLKPNVKSLRVFVSTPMEPDRQWEPDWGGLDVTVQKTITSAHRDVYKEGFERRTFRHLSHDSLPLLYRHRPDVILSLQLGFRTMQAAAYRLANPSCRLVIVADFSERTEKDIGRVRTAIRRALLSAADAVLVNGASGKRYVQRLGVLPERIVEAPYTADMTPFQGVSDAREPRAVRRLVYTGQLVEGKGLKLFMPALSRWATTHPSENWEVWFIGSGPLENYLRQFPLPSNVSAKVIGTVSHDELARRYAQAGILVLPTLLDTWALVVNEALAAGLPVLGSVYSQAVEELVRNGVNGWTFHPDDADEFQRALTQALSTPIVALEPMRKAARESVRHLTPEYAAGRFLEAIRVATNQKRQPDKVLQTQSCEQRP